MPKYPDHHMLEFAALAIGLGPVLCYEKRRNCLRIGDRESYTLWRPLTHAKDAVDLQEKLGLVVAPVMPNDWQAFKPFGGSRADPQPSVVRAIVAAAALEGQNKGACPTAICDIIVRVYKQ